MIKNFFVVPANWLLGIATSAAAQTLGKSRLNLFFGLDGFLGFYAKEFGGSIDEPKDGWKARGLWSSSGDRAP